MAAPPRPDVQTVRDLAIPLADGTRLSGDLCRPAGQRAGPVLVSYYPYRTDDIIGSLFEGTRIGLARRGYATLFADMTGTGASDGNYAESFDLPREGRDCADIIEWAARQDWCDGRVGAWGVSYGGMNALAAAAHRPPHLRALVAVYATTDMYRDTIAPGNCPAMLGRYAWAAHMLALGLCPPTRQDPGGRWQRTWQRRLRRLAAGRPHALDWQAHPGRDDYWQARVVDATAIEVPAMLIGGWADAYSDAMIRVFGQLTGPKRLIMGPWMHVLPHLSAVQPYDWVAAMADWWDTHLGPEPTGAQSAEEPPVLFFSHGGGWRAARQWPPGGVAPERFFLSGHRLDPQPPAEPGQHSYQTDPLVGLAAGIWDPFGTGSGWPEEQSGDDARSLSFTSDPLPGPLLIAGCPAADLCLSQPPDIETQLAARVCAVSPDGRSTLISTGWCRVPPAAGAAASDAAPGAAASDAASGAAGTPVRVTVTLGAAAVELPAGFRVRLSVACADFPHIWPTPSNPSLVLATGPGTGAELRLPVSRPADRGDRPAVMPPPPAGPPDTGWVTDGEPLHRVTQDKVSGEAAVTFGASSRLRPPSGADLRLAEEFTARIDPARPAGAAVLARVDASLRLPAGEQVQVTVRSTAHRQSSAIEASVTLDGTTLLHQRWAGPEPPPAAGHPAETERSS
jgi:uncharacterized protein